MALLNETKFSRELQKVLFPSNVFWNKGKLDFNADDAKTIKYPVAATVDGAEEGSPSLPLAIKNYEDGQAEYSTTQVYAGPILIKNEDEMLTNYSIFQDRVYQVSNVIQTKIANMAAFYWGATKSGRKRLTTGTTSRATSLVGASGNRKRISKADILWVFTQMQKDNMPGGNNIYGVITPEQYQDLLLIDDFISYEKTGQANKLAQGMVGRLMGIEFMIRWNETFGSMGLHYNQSMATKKGNGTAATTDDGAAALFFKDGAVRYSKSKVSTWIDRGKPEYLGGTLLSSSTRYGGVISRQDDEKGVLVLVEAKA